MLPFRLPLTPHYLHTFIDSMIVTSSFPEVRDPYVCGSIEIIRKYGHYTNAVLRNALSEFTLCKFCVSAVVVFRCGDPAAIMRWINVGLTLVHRLRRWTNVKPTLIQRRVSAGENRNPVFLVLHGYQTRCGRLLRTDRESTRARCCTNAAPTPRLLIPVLRHSFGVRSMAMAVDSAGAKVYISWTRACSLRWVQL